MIGHVGAKIVRPNIFSQTDWWITVIVYILKKMAPASLTIPSQMPPGSMIFEAYEKSIPNLLLTLPK